VPASLGPIEYIGLDFSFNTDFGGSIGEFLIKLTLLGVDEETNEEVDLLENNPYL
jgi:hypothetical protein